MKASTKHDLLMVGIGAAIGAAALFVVAKYAYPQLITGGMWVTSQSNRYPGFSQAGTVCPTCTTYSV